MTALRLVIADLRARYGLIAATVVLVAVPVAGFMVLDGFIRAVDRDYRSIDSPGLIVQEANSVGEITGSRIPAQVGEDILAAGATFAVPQIHAIAGTSNANAVLLRGVDLEQYQAVNAFDLIAGRALEPGDDPRAALIGSVLADHRGLEPGNPIRLRGRDFVVAGVFTTGTYVDNEAWIAIDEARRLLGWDDEVSIFIIPVGGPFGPGDVLPGPLSVARRGDFADTIDEWTPILQMSGTAAGALAVGAAVILATVLWRLSWLRRHDLAVLRSLGTGRWIIVGYLGSHATLVTGLGLGLGVGLGAVVARVVRLSALGSVTRPAIDAGVILRGSALALAMLLAAVAAAGAAALARSPAHALRRD